MGLQNSSSNTLFRVLTWFFSFFFGNTAGKNTKTLLRQLQAVSLGTVIAGMLITLFTMYAARRIGPGSFGTYMLALAIANTAMLPMLFGLNTASVHIIAKSRNPRYYVSAALFLVLVFAIVTSLLLLLFGRAIFDWFFIPHALLVPSIGLAALLAFAFLGDAFLRGMKQMQQLATFRLLQSLAFAALLIVLLFRYGHAMSPYLATTFGTLVFLCLALWNVRDVIQLRLPTFAAASSLLHYGTYAFLGSIAGSLFDLLDKLLLNRLVSTTVVGVYSAYLLVSVGIAGKMLSLLMVVLFPFFSGEKKYKELFMKFNHLAHKAAVYLFFGTMTLLIIGLPFIFGDAYSFSFTLIVLFAFAASLYFVVWGKMWLISATGLHGIRLVAVTALLAVLLNVGLNLFLIPLLGITGAALANVLTLLALVVCASVLQRHVIREQNRQNKPDKGQREETLYIDQ